MISRATPLFWQLYWGLSPELRTAARRAFHRFRENPAQPGLQLERLRCDARAWSVRVTQDCRAVARRNGDEWVWVWIGSHKEFDRRFPV